MRGRIAYCVSIGAVVACTGWPERLAVHARQIAGRPQPTVAASAAGAVRASHVRGSVSMLSGAGGNVALGIGADGIVVVDTGAASMSDNLLAAIRQLSSAPIQLLINTSAAADHTGGNAVLRAAGVTLTGGNAVNAVQGVDVGAAIWAHENVPRRMSALSGGQARRQVEWPTDTYYVRQHDLHFNGESVLLLHQANAVSDGDTLVHFRNSDVLVTGDIFRLDRYPDIDAQSGATIAGILAALNRIIEITVPAILQEGGTMVIPGHGRMCDESDVVDYRDMLTIIRDRVQDLVREGKTLEQVKAARLTRDYDGRFGATTGTWTTDLFVSALYRELAQSK